MIFSWSGKTGSGKTWQMVHSAYKKWKKGVDIYSNIPLDFRPTLFMRLFGRKGGRIVYFQNIEEVIGARNAIIIFDEAQVLFDARQWDKMPKEFSYKLEQHRKHRLDVYCTTQNIRRIDVNYRRLVQNWYRCKPLFLWLHFWEKLDVDEIQENVDDVKITVLKRGLFFIKFWTRPIYNTYFDIGFRRNQIIWQSNFLVKESKIIKQQRWFIAPKEMNLTEIQKQIKMLSPKKN